MTPCQVCDVRRRDRDGYAILPGGTSGVHIKAHRLAWALHNGADPAGMVVMHLCDNPPCVNPEHLMLGTKGDNRADCVGKDRHSHGENHGAAKLTALQVEAIRADNRKQCVIASKYGVSHQLVSRIKAGGVWRAKK